MNKLLYIFGTRTGRGVIEALEKYGGVNNCSYAGTGDHCLYFIMPGSNFICMADCESKFGEYIMHTAKQLKPLYLKWRAEKGGVYFIINPTFEVEDAYEQGNDVDNLFYKCGNYFRTVKDAEKVIKEIKRILSFE